MPVFDVFRINEKQLAKVKTVRAEIDNSIASTRNERDNTAAYQRWRNYIHQQSKTGLTSSRIERIFQ